MSQGREAALVGSAKCNHWLHEVNDLPDVVVLTHHDVESPVVAVPAHCDVVHRIGEGAQGRLYAGGGKRE